jgi:hypothetical protein
MDTSIVDNEEHLDDEEEEKEEEEEGDADELATLIIELNKLGKLKLVNTEEDDPDASSQPSDNQYPPNTDMGEIASKCLSITL